MFRKIHLGTTKMVFGTRDSRRKRPNIEESSLEQQRVEEARTISYPEEHYSKTKQLARMHFVKTPTQESIEDSLVGTWCPNRSL